MNKRLPVIIAGILFCLVALAHFIRLVYRWHVIIGGVHIPMSISIAGLVVTLIMALWLFATARRI